MNEEAAEHMRQRRELSALVHGIDNDALDLFFKLEPSRFERMADTYGYLFGKSAEEYMRATRAAWASDRIGVSGKNTARIMMVLPQFLTDEQRDRLLSKLQPIIGADQIKAWLEGLDSTVRNGIKVIAEPRRGVSVPTFSPRRVVSPPVALPPSQPRTYAMDAVVARVVSKAVPASPPPSTGSQSNAGVIVGILAVGFFILVVSLATPRTPGYTRAATSVASPINQAPVATPPSSLGSADTSAQPAPTPFSLEVKYFRRTKAKGASTAMDTIGGTNVDGSLWALSAKDANVGVQSGKYSFYVLRNRAASGVFIVSDKTGTLMFKIEGETGQQIGVLALPDFPTAGATRTLNAAPSPTVQGTSSTQLLLKTDSLPRSQTPAIRAANVPVPATGPAIQVPVPVVHVEGYTRPNGTYVAPYDRTPRDGTTSNNWSEKGNVNPITGKAGFSRR